MDKDVHIENLERIVDGLRREVADKDDEFRKLEAVVADLKRETTGKDLKIGNLEARVGLESTRANHAEVEAERIRTRLNAATRTFERESSELERIKSTFAWRLVQRYWAWNMRWFPFGTPRRTAYSRLIRAGGRLFGSRAAPSTSEFTQLTDGGEQTILFSCDAPRPGESCARTFAIYGWALAQNGIEKVEVLLDQRPIGEATLGHPRLDVAAHYSTFPGARHSGFLFKWDTTTVEAGPHVLTISAAASTGARRDVSVPVTVNQEVKSDYDTWIAVNEPLERELHGMAEQIKGLSYQPLVSIVLPVYRTPLSILRAAIESVRRQIYGNWELCLADDGSDDPELTRLLTNYTARDTRIKFKELPDNRGIATATNEALSLTTGEFIGFLDHDDELAPDALYWVARLLQDHRDADLIYSDEDKLDAAGNRCDPFFKPDWSPDLLLSSNYVCHFLVVRRQLLLDVKGIRTGYDGSQDYDLVLRLVERTQRIHHIPRVLYHWRAIETSTAFSSEAKPKAYNAAKRAVSDYLSRNNIAARVEQGCAQGWHDVRYDVSERPKVAVIMPTGGNMELLRPCLESFFRTTDYPNYEILVVDNSKGSQVQQYVASLVSRNGDLRYLDYRGKKFNFSALNNFAVGKTAAPLVLFLNDDMTMVNQDWLTAMVEHGQRPRVGAVGAKLLYPSGLIQHAGVVMGISGNCNHAFRSIPGDSRHYFCFPQIIRNCSAVTAACMLTKRALFLEMEGFDEKNLAVAFQDVDYCLRLRKAGYFIVYTPGAVLIHHESATKHEKIPNLREVQYMQTKWADVIARDPYYSPNLTRKSEDYSLRLE